MPVSNLVGMRVRHAVGTDNAVAVKVVVGWVVVVVVATIFIYLHAIFVFCAKSLVNKVPDKSALELGVFAHQVPVFLKSARAITHRMVILALYQGARFAVVARVIFAPLVCAIHGTGDVGAGTVYATAFPLHGSAWVVALNPLVCGGEVWPIGRFITQTPRDD